MSAYTVIYASPNTGVGTRGQVGIRVEANNTREAVALADPAVTPSAATALPTGSTASS